MDYLNLLSRRDFLKEAGLLGLVGTAHWAGGCESCQQQIQNRPTRKNIQELWNANHSDPVITTYKNAVAAMKALPSSDPRSWQAQALLHNKQVHPPELAVAAVASSLSAVSGAYLPEADG